MIYTFEYKHPGESDEMWRESSQRHGLDRIVREAAAWMEVNALNKVVVEVRLVPLSYAK